MHIKNILEDNWILKGDKLIISMLGGEEVMALGFTSMIPVQILNCINAETIINHKVSYASKNWQNTLTISL